MRWRQPRTIHQYAKRDRYRSRWYAVLTNGEYRRIPTEDDVVGVIEEARTRSLAFSLYSASDLRAQRNV